MRKRNGLTLIELGVVISTLGILMSILMPAMQQIRGVARSKACGNKLRVIGAGAQTYEIINGRYPCQLGASGAILFGDFSNSASSNYFGQQQTTSPLAFINQLVFDPVTLPAIFWDFDQQIPDGSFFWSYPEYNQALVIPRPQFLCGAAFEENDPLSHTTLIQPVYNQDPQTEDQLGFIYFTDTNELSVQGTSYIGMLGAGTGGAQRAPSENWRFRGMITSRETVTQNQVASADGTSNTLMFGETTGTIAATAPGVVRFKQSWFASGVGRGRGNKPFLAENTAAFPLFGDGNQSVTYGFGSPHPKTVAFVKGDGSVQLVGRQISTSAYYQMCGAFDTE